MQWTQIDSIRISWWAGAALNELKIEKSRQGDNFTYFQCLPSAFLGFLQATNFVLSGRFAIVPNFNKMGSKVTERQGSRVSKMAILHWLEVSVTLQRVTSCMAEFGVEMYYQCWYFYRKFVKCALWSTLCLYRLVYWPICCYWKSLMLTNDCKQTRHWAVTTVKRRKQVEQRARAKARDHVKPAGWAPAL